MSTEPEQIEEKSFAVPKQPGSVAPDSQDTESDPLIGSILAERYRILSLLGRGGMSSVYKAEQIMMKREVALKVLHAHLQTDSTSIKRFEQESLTSAGLCHPNLVMVHDFGKAADGCLFLVMDYISGQSLEAELHQLMSLNFRRATDIFIQAAAGLAAVHEHGVIHRDIKPSNIMLSELPDGKDLVKIVDFGIAKVLDLNADTLMRLTETGQVFGSPLYMSPEQCEGLKLDKRSDIYSLGCVFYETLCGMPPHVGVTAMDTMRRHVSVLPQAFSRVMPDIEIPAALEEIVFKMIEKDPGKRYQDLHELEKDLRSLQERDFKKDLGLPVKMARINRAVRRRFNTSQTQILSAIIILLLFVLSCVWGYPSLISFVFEHYYNQAVKEYKNSDYKNAEASLQIAELWADRMNDHGGSMSRTLELLSGVYKKLGDYIQMEKTRSKQQKIVQTQLEERYGLGIDELEHMANNALVQTPVTSNAKTATDSIDELVYRLNALSAVCVQHGRLIFAEKLMRKAIQLREESDGGFSAGISSLYGNLALICAKRGNYGEAEIYFAKQLQSARKFPGPHKAELISALCNMLKVCTSEKNFLEAQKFAEEALTTAKEQTGEDSLLVKSCLEDYAALLRAKGDANRAAELEDRASKIQVPKNAY